MYSVFWGHRHSIPNFAYFGGVSDANTTSHPEESPAGNFNVAHKASERVATLRPILNPKAHAPLASQLRKHAEDVLAS